MNCHFNSQYLDFHPVWRFERAFLGVSMDLTCIFAGHHSHMLLCSPWLIVFGPRPPQCKSQSLTKLYWRDMFLVNDSCSMLNHVKPQLCARVLVCQKAYSTVGACLTSRFHALSASKLANSCVFHQKWFLKMCFFPLYSWWGERGMTGGLGGRATDKSETCLVLGTIHAHVY